MPRKEKKSNVAEIKRNPSCVTGKVQDSGDLQAKSSGCQYPRVPFKVHSWKSRKGL